MPKKRTKQRAIEQRNSVKRNADEHVGRFKLRLKGTVEFLLTLQDERWGVVW